MRSHQIGTPEALFEPGKDGRKDEMCFLDTMLVPPQTAEARRAAKLPGQSALPVSAIEALRETLAPNYRSRLRAITGYATGLP